MKKKTEEITKTFFRGLFGKLIADILVQQKLERYKIKNFEKLDTQKKVEIGQKIIEDVFKNFYSTEKIDNMKILYLLRFTLNEASAKVEDMIKKDCEIRLESPEDLDTGGSEDLIHTMEDSRNIKFVFEWSELLEGDLVIVLNKQSALQFSKVFMQAMMGMSSDDDNLDDMKISAINEFFNIILPVFSKVIGDSFKKIVFFTPRTYDDFKIKYYFGENFIEPQKLIRTRVSIVIDRMENNGELYFFIKQATGGFKALLDQAQLKKDLFEMAPPRIIVKATGNVRYDVDNFFDTMKLSKDNIDYLLRVVYKPNFTNFDYSDFIKFYQRLISDFFPNASENKKQVIKLNLMSLLGLNK